ncbi:MAG: hypothetical protein ACKVTZ_07540 [Bacteroidia bacterium]
MENVISKTQNVLLVLENKQAEATELQQLMENFCGIVVKSLSEVEGELRSKRLYVCGDISQFENIDGLAFIIKELSYHYETVDNENFKLINLGQVPVIVSNSGVYFRQLFEENGYFERIKAEHEFQALTESTKPGTAFRKGIYLAEVVKEITQEHNEVLHFHLLRCSSNFSGATGNFREADHEVLKIMNEAAKYVFEQETKLNHVLAQIYENTKSEVKETKAKIKAHSDKTKDMPQEALIAFCTFYDNANFKQLTPSKTDRYDWCYKETSALTRLVFKLKNTVNDDSLAKEFSVTLYPNSVFFIPLSTNRLYTHEIKPSILNVDKIPTRMGYVARCSNVEAVFMNEQTYLKEKGKLIKLEEMTLETLTELKETYREENITEHKVKYGKVHFSMNQGDYQKPIF